MIFTRSPQKKWRTPAAEGHARCPSSRSAGDDIEPLVHVVQAVAERGDSGVDDLVTGQFGLLETKMDIGLKQTHVGGDEEIGGARVDDDGLISRDGLAVEGE